MKKFIALSTVTLYALLTGCEPAQAANTALIWFTGKNDLGEPGGKKCSIPIQAGETFMGDTACKNDEVYYYLFDNVPSATLITLDAENTCRGANDPGDWQFTLRAYINPTITQWRKISDLRGLNPRDIVTAGILYERGYYNKGDIDGKLSCVKIEP